MIRKAVIVVLTLGAVAVAVESLRALLREPVWRGFALYEPPSVGVLFGGGTTCVSGFLLADPQARDIMWAWPQVRDRSWAWLVFGLQRRRSFTGENDTYVHTAYRALCPSAFLVCILAAYPAIAFIRGPLRRWRRRRKGLCQNCGYNLTGNVAGVCSECGVTHDAQRA